MENQKPIILKTNVNAKNDRSFFSKICLPVILLVSFAWLNLYSSLSEANNIFRPDDTYSSIASYLFTSALIFAVVDYLVFELYFFVYRLFLGFSVYSLLIPKNVLIDKFRIWYIVRNIVLGVVFNLRFFFPYIGTYLIIFEIAADFAFIILLFVDLKKDYIEPLVSQFVFRTLVMPIILYEIYLVITYVVGVLWSKF